jgi:hypothetical protein
MILIEKSKLAYDCMHFRLYNVVVKFPNVDNQEQPSIRTLQ